MRCLMLARPVPISHRAGRIALLPFLLLQLGLVISVTGQAVAVPVIGVAKQATATTDLGGGLFETMVTITIENLGDENLSTVQIKDDLVDTFPAPATYSVTVGPTTTGGLTANGSYDGSSDINLLVGTDSLLIGATATVSFTVQFQTNGATPPFLNRATATAEGPAADPTTDDSDDGTDPDPDGDGNPNEAGENDPTPIGIPPTAVPAVSPIGLGLLATLLIGAAAGSVTREGKDRQITV